MFVSMHNLARVVQIFQGFLVLTRVHIDNTSIQVEILFIENVFLVEILIACFKPIQLLVVNVGLLRSLRSLLQLVIESWNFILIKIWDILVIIFFFLLVLLFPLNSEPQIVSFLFAFSDVAVLFFSAPWSSNLICFCSICRWNQLGVMVLYRRFVGYFSKTFIRLWLD